MVQTGVNRAARTGDLAGFPRSTWIVTDAPRSSALAITPRATRCPTPRPPILGQQRDVDDADLVCGPVVDVEPAGRLAVHLDHRERRAGRYSRQ